MIRAKAISFFSVQLECLQTIAFDRQDSLKSKITSKTLKFLNLFSLLFCASSEAFFVTKNFSDVLASAEAAGIVFISLISLSKLVTFWIWKDKKERLIEKIEKLASEGKSCHNLFFVSFFSFFQSSYVTSKSLSVRISLTESLLRCIFGQPK